jgi:two-component system response regulator HydG
MSGSGDLVPDDFLLARRGPSDETLPFDTFNLQEIEKAIIRRAMERFDGNVSRVARELGVSRPALYRRLKDHGI